MKALDTNILVRHLVQDDAAQAAKASRFISTLTAENPGYINRIVLCELVWVLESAYDYPRKIIAPVLEKLLMTTQFRIEDNESAREALTRYTYHKVDFADAFLGKLNAKAGCSETVTLDKDAARHLDEFTLLG